MNIPPKGIVRNSDSYPCGLILLLRGPTKNSEDLATSTTSLLITIYIGNRKLHTSTTFRQAVKYSPTRISPGDASPFARAAISR